MSLKFTILGCGSSMGVPRSDGYFGKCNPNNIKNYNRKKNIRNKDNRNKHTRNKYNRNKNCWDE